MSSSSSSATSKKKKEPFVFDGPLAFSLGTSSSSSTSLSLSDSIASATRLLVESNFDDCLTLLSSLLERHPTNGELLDLRVECLVCQRGGAHVGDSELQEAVLTACSANPNVGYSKWMYLGQMTGDEPKKAQKAFCKGVEIIDGELNNKGLSRSSRLPLLGSKCSAFVSIAELFMTPPGCDEDDAEFQCETAIRLALETDPTHAEALYTLASLRMVQQRDNDAEEALDRCLAQLRKMKRFAQIPITEAVAQQNEGEDRNNDKDDIKDESSMSDTPSTFSSSSSSLDTFDLRLNVSKLCVELNHFAEAERLLTELHEENDSILEIQHLLAVVKFHRGKFTQCIDIINKAIESADVEIAALAGQKGKEAKGARKELQRLRGIMLELRQNAEMERTHKGDAKESEDEGEEEDDIEDEDEELEEEDTKREMNGNGHKDDSDENEEEEEEEEGKYGEEDEHDEDDAHGGEDDGDHKMADDD